MSGASKEKNIKEVVAAISKATEDKIEYMVAWLDGWECCKNALSASSTSKPNQLQQET